MSQSCASIVQTTPYSSLVMQIHAFQIKKINNIIFSLAIRTNSLCFIVYTFKSHVLTTNKERTSREKLATSISDANQTTQSSDKLTIEHLLHKEQYAKRKDKSYVVALVSQ